MGIVKHSQSSQNSKFAMSLQKKGRDEVDFLHANKHQNFLQVDFNALDTKVSYDTILLGEMGVKKFQALYHKAL